MIKKNNVEILFIPGNLQHAKLFTPVCKGIQCMGYDTAFLCVDSISRGVYHCKEYLKANEFMFFEPGFDYRTDLRDIFPDFGEYKRVRRCVESMLLPFTRLKKLVLANDNASMFWRLVVDCAKKNEIETVLIQEGLRPRLRKLGVLKKCRAYTVEQFFSEVRQSIANVFHLGPFFAKGYGLNGCDKLFVSGESFKNHFISQGVDPSRIYVTGHPLLHNLWGKYHVKVNSDRWSSERRNGSNYPIKLLFCNQPLECRQKFLDDLIVKLCRFFDSTNRYEFRIRLHPRDMGMSHWDSLEKENGVRVIDKLDKNESLGDSFAWADYMMVVASTTALEALGSGTPLIMMNHLPTQWILPFDEYNVGVAIEREKDLFRFLCSESFGVQCDYGDIEKIFINEIGPKDIAPVKRICNELTKR